MGDRHDIDKTAQRGRTVAPVISCSSLVLTLVRVILMEGLNMMGAPVETIISLVASLLDPAMTVWIAVIMTAGYWLKRSKLPSWAPPLPVILLLMYVAISCLFGWLQYEVESWKGVVKVLLYGIGNGVVFTGISFIIYDIGHGAIKKAKAKKEQSGGEAA